MNKLVKNYSTKVIQHSLFKNTFALFALQSLNFLLPLILLPFLTRALGIDVYGIVAFTFSIIQVATIVTDYGFNLHGTYGISRNRDDRQFVSSFLSNVSTCKLCLFFLVSLLLALFIALDTRYVAHHDVFWIALLSIAGITFQPIWFFQGIEKMKYITYYTAFAKASYVVLVLVLVDTPSDAFLVLLANGISQIAAAVISWRLVYRLGYRFQVPQPSSVLGAFRESTEFFWSRAAAAVYVAAGSFFLGLFAAPKQVAIYAASDQLYKGVQNAFSPVIQAIYPYMAKNRDFSLFFRILKIAFAACLLLMLVVYCSANQIISLLYGAEFSLAQDVFYILIVALAVTVPSMLLGYPFLGALGKSAYANYSVIFAGILFLLILFLLYVTDSMTAVAVATAILVVEVSVLTIRSFYGYKCYTEAIKERLEK